MSTVPLKRIAVVQNDTVFVSLGNYLNLLDNVSPYNFADIFNFFANFIIAQFLSLKAIHTGISSKSGRITPSALFLTDN